MRRGTLTLLFFIVLLAAGAGYVVWPNNPGLHIPFLGISNPLTFREGLDLQGGVRVLLVPDSASVKSLSASDLNSNVSAARDQIEQRVNGGLGVSEPDIRVQTSQGVPSIVVELPGYTSGNQFQAVNSLLNTGKLEFWSTGPSAAPIGQPLDPTQYTTYNPGNKPWFTGKDLDSSQVGVGADQAGRPVINFAMKPESAAAFASFTQKYVGQFLTVTLDRKVIESATIQTAINGPGQITGTFTQADAQNVVTLLKYGALPISFTIQSEETVGATLGADSVQKSIIAAVIGLGIVIAFMLLYYRLPGFLADIALLLYTATTLAIFKLIGVTMSLAGIAGFILSVGMAVDANVLIFERVKEELRAGRLLSAAIDIGWKRAWPSIRDSNFSTLITCSVLYFFGNNFGATIIVGFATTLFLGVLISMFTAVVVTRTLLNLLVPTGVVSHPALFGLPRDSITTPSATLAGRNSTV